VSLPRMEEPDWDGGVIYWLMVELFFPWSGL
jgi:hypothetical protein